VEEDDREAEPGLRCRVVQVRLEPRGLRRSLTDRLLGVEREEVNAARVKAVVRLAAVEASSAEEAQRVVRELVALLALVVADRGEERALRQQASP
jgi:hypothetical protein